MIKKKMKIGVCLVLLLSTIQGYLSDDIIVKNETSAATAEQQKPIINVIEDGKILEESSLNLKHLFGGKSDEHANVTGTTTIDSDEPKLDIDSTTAKLDNLTYDTVKCNTTYNSFVSGYVPIFVIGYVESVLTIITTEGLCVLEFPGSIHVKDSQIRPPEPVVKRYPSLGSDMRFMRLLTTEDALQTGFILEDHSGTYIILIAYPNVHLPSLTYDITNDRVTQQWEMKEKNLTNVQIIPTRINFFERTVYGFRQMNNSQLQVARVHVDEHIYETRNSSIYPYDYWNPLCYTDDSRSNLINNFTYRHRWNSMCEIPMSMPAMPGAVNPNNGYIILFGYNGDVYSFSDHIVTHREEPYPITTFTRREFFSHIRQQYPDWLKSTTFIVLMVVMVLTSIVLCLVACCSVLGRDMSAASILRSQQRGSARHDNSRSIPKPSVPQQQQQPQQPSSVQSQQLPMHMQNQLLAFPPKSSILPATKSILQQKSIDSPGQISDQPPPQSVTGEQQQTGQNSPSNSIKTSMAKTAYGTPSMMVKSQTMGSGLENPKSVIYANNAANGPVYV